MPRKLRHGCRWRQVHERLTGRVGWTAIGPAAPLGRTRQPAALAPARVGRQAEAIDLLERTVDAMPEFAEIGNGLLRQLRSGEVIDYWPEKVPLREQ